MEQKQIFKGAALACLGAFGWGISGICSQYLFMHYDLAADWLTAVRMVLSGIVLLATALPKEHTRVFKIWKVCRDVLWLLAFLFVYCTFRPPHLGLWRDLAAGLYGIP